MRLKKQLLLASLFTLSFPWAGCQYLREVNKTLLQQQQETIDSTARALRLSLERRPDIAATLERAQPEGRSVYFHRLNSAPTLDGYAEDWDSQSLPAQVFQTPDTDVALTVFAGIARERYLLLVIETDEFDYYNPASTAENSSHVRLILVSDSGALHHYLLTASSPGNLQCFRLNEAAQWQLSHDIRGVWRDQREGFQLELRLPPRIASAGLGLMFKAGAHARGLGNIEAHQLDLNSRSETPQRADAAEIPRILYQSSALDDLLSEYLQKGQRLTLATAEGAILGQAGVLPAHTAEAPWLLQRLFRYLLGEADTDKKNSATRGYIALNNTPQTRGRAQQLLHIGAQRYWLQVEQRTSSYESLTNAALTRLLLYSMLVSVIAALAMLAYATWLSWRIRKLNWAAQRALDDGEIATIHVPRGNNRDEIGELSAAYAELLSRVRDYTDYLNSLADKLSHELRTPLAVVSSSLDNLEHEPLSSEARVYSQRARDGAERLAKILNAMSSARRIEQAIASAELEEFVLADFLRDLISAYADLHTEKNFILSLHESARAQAVRAAPDLLVQLMDKLIDNATDFCPPGGLIEVSVRADKQQALIRVYNDGPLLPEAMQHQMFDSMVSVRENQDAGKPHLGLGLYIVKLIVEFHRGKIKAYNAEHGRGVEFHLSFPHHGEHVSQSSAAREILG